MDSHRTLAVVVAVPGMAMRVAGVRATPCTAEVEVGVVMRAMVVVVGIGIK